MSIDFRERPTQEHNFQLEVRKAGGSWATYAEVRMASSSTIGDP